MDYRKLIAQNRGTLTAQAVLDDPRRDDVALRYTQKDLILLCRLAVRNLEEHAEGRMPSEDFEMPLRALRQELDNLDRTFDVAVEAELRASSGL